MLNASSRKGGRPQGGFTLVELMVGLVVGLIVIAGVISVYLFAIRGTTYFLQSARLNQEIRAAVDLMASDIRRAGYWATAQDPAIAGNPNPFTDVGKNLAIHDHDDGTANCVLFTYDALFRGGNAGQVNSPEDYFGFRLTGNVLEVLQADGTSTDNCTNGTWLELTDPNSVAIETLRFSTVGSRCLNTVTNDHWVVAAASVTDQACEATVATGYEVPASGHRLIELRQVQIELVARHAADPNVRIVYQGDGAVEVKVRNDRIRIQP